MTEDTIWKNWRSISENIKYDSHHAEIVNIETGEVIMENLPKSNWEDMVDYEVNFCNRKRNYYRTLRIYRMNVGDAFCTTDWSKY